ALATQMAAKYGAVVSQLRPGDAPPDGLFEAVLYNLDDLPSSERPAFLEGFCHEPPDRPTAVHGYDITDEQAESLRRQGIAVGKRLHRGLIRSLCQSVRRSRATVQPANALTDLTWVNVVE